MTTPDRHDGANAQHCDAKANRLSGWKHFALAERAAKFGYWRTTFSDGKMFWSPGMYRLLGVDPRGVRAGFEREYPGASERRGSVAGDVLAQARPLQRDGARFEQRRGDLRQ